MSVHRLLCLLMAVAESLPRPALNFARRALSLARNGNGRYVIEFLVIDGRWIIIVDQSTRIEDLGQIDTAGNGRYNDPHST